MATTKNNNKDRIFRIAQILYNETDSAHRITINQLIERLNSEGISAYRTTISDDVEILNKYGMNIKCNRGKQLQYYIADRHFSVAEIKLLVDCVASSGTLNDNVTKSFVDKLTKYVSIHQRKSIKNNFFPNSYFKRDNPNIVQIIDNVNRAINQKKQIKFKYFEYDINNNHIPKSGIEYRYLSPYKLYWKNGNYYVIGWGVRNGNKGRTIYRLDRIENLPIVVDSPAFEPDKFDVKKYVENLYDMYYVEPKKVELLCHNDLINEFIDKFGSKPQKIKNDKNTFRATVSMGPNRQFYGWVFSKAGKVKIVGPKEVKKEYTDMVKDVYNDIFK